MSIPNDGGPAFPFDWVDFQPTTGDQVVREQFPGMTLLDFFAAHETLSDFDHPETSGPPLGVAELLAGPAPDKCNGNTVARYEWEALWRAKLKYIRAVAMLKARSK